MRLIAIKPLTILAFTVGAFPVNTVLAQIEGTRSITRIMVYTQLMKNWHG